MGQKAHPPPLHKRGEGERGRHTHRETDIETERWRRVDSERERDIYSQSVHGIEKGREKEKVIQRKRKCVCGYVKVCIQKSETE